MSIYVISNELTHFNQTLVRDAGITDKWSEDVVILFEGVNQILTGSARLKGNALSVKRKGRLLDKFLDDLVTIDLTRAILIHVELKTMSLKPAYAFPIGWQPIRPILGVHFGADGDRV